MQITAEIEMIQRNQVVEKTTILEEIWQNRTKKQEVWRELEKKDRQSWEEDGIVYVDGRIYIPNNQKIKEKILQKKPWSSRYRTSRTTTNDEAYQKELLVARNKEQCQEVCSRMIQMPAKQSTTYEESWRTTSLKDTKRTMEGDQHWCYWSITKI